MESDWRKFREITPHLRERYLAECNARIVRILTEPNKSETERFWDGLEEMTKEAKILQRCLDGHSRSSMWSYLVTMKHAGMLRVEDMDGFSEELRTRLSEF